MCTPHALAMQAKKIQHSQPEELAMLAILFLHIKCWDRWTSKNLNVLAMLGKVEISSSAFENDDFSNDSGPRNAWVGMGKGTMPSDYAGAMLGLCWGYAGFSPDPAPQARSIQYDNLWA